ncbi:HAD-like domain-containing protein [Paraphoma chrysanthemicola]|nr:HAD-like domain-containing protein [Paraphoma chrysanthemicola]
MPNILSKLFCFRRRGSKKNAEVEPSSPLPPLLKTRSSSITHSQTPEKKTSTAELPVEGATSSQQRTLILDLGDVLFHYSARTLTALSPSTFHAVILTPAWNQYECGRLTEDEVLEAVGKELSLEPDTIREALSQCRETLRVDHELYAQLKALKAEMNGNLKVYAMTNISGIDFGRLKAILPSWDLFDAEFTSFEAGMIKPELGYYKHVLDSIDLAEPSSAIFVDDKVANVNAARSFGIHGIVFKSASEVMRQLRNQLYDPVTRARQFMKDNARNHVSQIEGGPEFRDVFSQFLIHKVLQDESIISLSPAAASAAEIEEEIGKARLEAKTWNYFIGAPVGTTKDFPEDVDDTATALLAFSPPANSANPVLDRFLANRHSRDGLVQTYFDEKRPRVCPVVLTNVVRVFYHYNRGADIQNEFQHIRNVLLNRAYIDGTAMYISAEPFLFFFSCLVAENPGAAELQALREPLALALRMRVGRRGDAFAVAVRVLACQSLGVWADSDIEHLKELQESDGGWEVGWVCRYGRTQKRIGSRGVITAYAIKALEQHARQ